MKRAAGAMPAFFHFLLFFFLVLLFVHPSAADPLGNYCSEQKLINSTRLQANIDRVLSALAARTPSAGFATSSSGRGSEAAYGLAQCRGDVNTTDCDACIHDAAREIKRACARGADARIWYDYCFLRYDTEDFVGRLDTGYWIIYYNVENTTEPERFVEKLAGVMDRVKKEAVASGKLGLGRDTTKFSPFVTIYGLGQCIRDLSPLQCAHCLDTAISRIPDYCLYRKGCRVLYSSCYLRYEVYPFFFPLDPPGKKASRAADAARMVHP